MVAQAFGNKNDFVMSNQPRAAPQLNPSTRRIHERWEAIRSSELKPMQFHISHGLLLITCCALFFATLRGCLSNSRTEQSLALRIQAAGGSVTWEQPSFQSREHVVAVNMNQRGVSTQLLREIMKLPELRALYLGNCRLTDTDVLSLQPPPHLTRISLDYNPVSDQSVRHLARSTNLESIDLRGCAISNESLRFLGQCSALWQLNLDDTFVSDTGLMALSRSTSLKVLGLRDTQVSDAGIPYLQDLKRLVRLELDGTSVSQAAADELNAVLPNNPAKLDSNK